MTERFPNGLDPAAGSAFKLAHLSDLHATPVEIDSPRDLMGKRALGWLSWRRRRRDEHRPEVLEALIDDLHAQGADHVGVTGDLTHLGLDSEIRAAADWLERLGPSSGVTVVPGNHDAYAGRTGAERWAPWASYMGIQELRLQGPGTLPRTAGSGKADEDERGTEGFPWARRLGAVALVGVSSARPTAPLLATGRVGARQRAELETLLLRLAEEGRPRVLLIHHPPLPAGQSRRRQLDDAEAVRAILARAGAELVLHGHTHRTHLDRVAGPAGPIPVVGVPSASSIGHRPSRRARYHLYRIVPAEPGPDGIPRCSLSLEVRGFEASTGGFVGEASGPL